MLPAYDEFSIRRALPRAWSLDTAVQWTPDNPANGQCNVTAAVIHDLFGGEVLRTQLPGVWHYYNRINGERVDFSDSQFTAPGARFAAPQTHASECLPAPPQGLRQHPRSVVALRNEHLAQ